MLLLEEFEALNLFLLLDSGLESGLLVSESALLSWRDLLGADHIILILENLQFLVSLLDVFIGFYCVSTSLFRVLNCLIQVSYLVALGSLLYFVE